MAAPTSNKEELEKALLQAGAERVHVGIFDLFGLFRERRFHGRDLLQSAEDARFVNCLPQWDCMDQLFGGGPFLSEPISFDPVSVRPYPFEPQAAYLVADFAGSSKGFAPREILKTQISRARSLGFDIRSGFEFEFIVLEETAQSLRDKGFDDLVAAWPDNRSWSGTIEAIRVDLVRELERVLTEADVPIYMLTGELGPGVFEATLRSREALRAADDAAFFRQITRVVARRQGRTASFMPQLGPDYPGIGGHVNISLHDRKSAANLFAGPNPEAMSELAQQFIAGMMMVVPDAFPMCAHSVNAYRRLALGSWAPKTVSWAPWNYAAAIRAVPSPQGSARLEFRLPGADCHTHLTLALVIAAGLYGIEHKLAAPPPIVSGGPSEIPQGVPQLPHDLYEATLRFQKSGLTRTLFGDAFVEQFARACLVEDGALQKAVSAAERKRYLEAG